MISAVDFVFGRRVMARPRQGKLLQLSESLERNEIAISRNSTNRQLRLIRKARQVNARQEQTASFQALKREIQNLRDQLAEWEEWYYCGLWYTSVEYEVDARLRHIKPVIQAKVLASVGNASTAISSSTRAARNVAVHNYSDSIANLTINAATAKASQRGARRNKTAQNHSWDVFALLAGMAAESPTIENAGAFVTASAGDIDNKLGEESSVDDPDCDSLLNILHRHREVHENEIKGIIAESNDRSWMLEYEDIVYVQRDPRPFKVYRIGFGEYERLVRVARLCEDTNVWANGQWVFTDQCFKLEFGDRLMATRDCIDASEHGNKMPEGHVYIIIQRQR